MSTDTVALIVNEVSTGREPADLEKTVGNLRGVQRVEVGKTPQHGMGPSESLAKMVRVTFDAEVTNPQALRSDLETLGYAVTAVAESGE